MKMKLEVLLPKVEKRFSKIQNLENHIKAVKAKGNYSNLDVRVAYDCLHVCFSSEEICSWYDQYNCNDNHIQTLILKAFKNVFGDIISTIK